MSRLRATEWAAIAASAVIALGLLLVVVLNPSSAPAHSGHRVPQPVTAAAHSDGLSDQESGYRFEQVVTPGERGARVPVAFRIVGPDGPVTRFQENQTKQVHFFAVRDDMHIFQHVHPVLDGDTWRTELALPDGGAYRMFAEFIPLDSADPTHPIVLGVPFSIPGDTDLVPLPPPESEVRTGSGFTVSRTDGTAVLPVRTPTILRVSIRDSSGAPVRRLDEHLGANGHMTGFNTMLLSATHLHPIEPVGVALIDGELTFNALFAERGEHRLFLEFDTGGRVHTAALTVMVS